MFRLTPVVRITLALVLLTTTLVLSAGTPKGRI